jgi:hypothetical protein
VVHKQEEIERLREFIPAEDERKDAGRDQPRCGQQQQRDRDQNARKGGQPSREGAKNRVGPDSFAPQRYRASARELKLCNQVQCTILRLFNRFVVKGNGTRRDVTTNVTLLVPFLPALPFPSTFSGPRVRLGKRLACGRSASRAVTAAEGMAC